GQAFDGALVGDDVELGRVEPARRGRGSHEERLALGLRNDARHPVREEEQAREVLTRELVGQERPERQPLERLRERRPLEPEVRRERDPLVPGVVLPELGLLVPVELPVRARDLLGRVLRLVVVALGDRRALAHGAPPFFWRLWIEARTPSW